MLLYTKDLIIPDICWQHLNNSELHKCTNCLANANILWQHNIYNIDRNVRSVTICGGNGEKLLKIFLTCTGLYQLEIIVMIIQISGCFTP